MADNQQKGEPLLGVNHLAERYSLKPGTIRDWLRLGLLPGRRINNRWSTTWDEIFHFEGRLALPRGEAREEAKRPLWTVGMVAEHYGRQPGTVRGWFRSNRLAGWKIMGEWYTNNLALREFDLRFGR